MRRLIKTIIIFGVIGGIGFFVYQPISAYLEERGRVTYRQAKVSRGDIIAVVNSTGTVEPVLSVHVGSFVSGPIIELHAGFNDEVKAGDILAKIDPRIYDANVARDRATLVTRQADVDRVEALLQQATNDQARSERLRAENPRFISDTEMDQYKFTRLSLEAQLAVAQAAVDQAQATLDNSEANLGYTEITSPVDGIVIERVIDEGQTLAAQFQTPELFVIAPRMREEMHVFAAVDEADIGLILEAQLHDQPVHFTVDAYPDDLFEGRIFQIRKNATVNQNVVTYPVVVTTTNLDLKLFPGMTASLSFQVGKVEDVLKIPNAALRFYPERERVHPDDRELLEGAAYSVSDEEEDDQQGEVTVSAEEQAAARRERNRRHVWVQEGDFLRAIEVITGLSDSKYTEVVSGDLREDQELVTGIEPSE